MAWSDLGMAMAAVTMAAAVFLLGYYTAVARFEPSVKLGEAVGREMLRKLGDEGATTNGATFPQDGDDVIHRIIRLDDEHKRKAHEIRAAKREQARKAERASG